LKIRQFVDRHKRTPDTADLLTLHRRLAGKSLAPLSPTAEA